MKAVLQSMGGVLMAGGLCLVAWLSANEATAQTRSYDPRPENRSSARPGSVRRADPPPQPHGRPAAAETDPFAEDYREPARQRGQVRQASHYEDQYSYRPRAQRVARTSRFSDEPSMTMEPMVDEGTIYHDYETQQFGDGMHRGPYHSGRGWHDGCASCDDCGAGAFSGGCGDSCGSCGDRGDCGSCGTCSSKEPFWWLKNATVFGGAHGFKGPLDLGRNGNFGLHEGVNIGGPAPLLHPLDIGYQLGGQIAHSNFSGDNATNVLRTEDRTQYFVTAGLFRRVRELRPHHIGFQWGVAADWLNDEYYVDYNLWQIRAEASIFGFRGQEIGYSGHFGSDTEELDTSLTNITLPMTIRTTNQHRFFFRKHFCGGGQWRIYGGFTDSRDGLFGSDFEVPLSPSFAMQCGFNYLKPRQGPSVGGANEEAWGMAINLVWYPGKSAQNDCNPWRPLFNVADNASFMTDINDDN